MPTMSVIAYIKPSKWISYDLARVAGPLIEAKSAVMSLTNVPYQRAWAERLQDIQLKQEVAGTSRIEGADFTENELDAALRGETAEEALTRSQKQARAAVNTYRWISSLPDDRPIDAELVKDIHRRIVTGCDDDHCEPGGLRKSGENVTFGAPRHRGVEGGHECTSVFLELIDAVNGEFRGHDILIRALAFHYHIGAMHPFLDGNGRTARAVEALMLQRAGLRDGTFIALSNYYYDEKTSYLRALSAVKSNGGDMTAFLSFGLTGIAVQCKRLLNEINTNISKALFRDISNDLFHRLASSRKRVIADRQLAIIHLLLEEGEVDLSAAFRRLKPIYNVKNNPWAAFTRDAFSLENLGAIEFDFQPRENPKRVSMKLRLTWPTEITETEFFRKTRSMPRVKNLKYLAFEGNTRSAADDVSKPLK
jgi:Fic family protein